MENINIIENNKKYKGFTKKTKNSKKMILYNENNDILIYKKDSTILLPTVFTNSEEEFMQKVQETTGVEFENNRVDYFLRILNYSKHIECINNKLKRIYLNEIRDYYACMVDLKKEIEGNIAPVNKFGKSVTPQIINIDEILYTYVSKKFYSQTEEALEEFKQKVLIKK